MQVLSARKNLKIIIGYFEVFDDEEEFCKEYAIWKNGLAFEKLGNYLQSLNGFKNGSEEQDKLKF
ncbi:MAG: hypothetical protein R2764_19585 [Bacteroidales bacterium]